MLREADANSKKSAHYCKGASITPKDSFHLEVSNKRQCCVVFNNANRYFPFWYRFQAKTQHLLLTLVNCETQQLIEERIKIFGKAKQYKDTQSWREYAKVAQLQQQYPLDFVLLNDEVTTIFFTFQEYQSIILHFIKTESPFFREDYCIFE